MEFSGRLFKPLPFYWLPDVNGGQYFYLFLGCQIMRGVPVNFIVEQELVGLMMQ